MASAQGWWLSQMDPVAAASPQLVVGLLMWLFGLTNVVRADSILRNLRGPGETGYKIPQGGLFTYVSAANYTAEIIEWSGFALASGTLAAFAFAWFTACNLVPRGLTHHRWYRSKFEDYPECRKAVIPWLL